MKIGPYSLGEMLVPGPYIKEISGLEYIALPKMFKGEKIFRVPDVGFLGYGWNMMVGTVGQRIYKLSAQFVENSAAAADAVYADSCGYCEERFGKRTGTALGKGAEWDTPFGNVVLDRRSALGRHYVSFQCTDGSVVRSAGTQTAAPSPSRVTYRNSWLNTPWFRRIGCLIQIVLAVAAYFFVRGFFR